jgi:hypothetical protein
VILVELSLGGLYRLKEIDREHFTFTELLMLRSMETFCQYLVAQGMVA